MPPQAQDLERASSSGRILAEIIGATQAEELTRKEFWTHVVHHSGRSKHIRIRENARRRRPRKRRRDPERLPSAEKPGPAISAPRRGRVLPDRSMGPGGQGNRIRPGGESENRFGAPRRARAKRTASLPGRFRPGLFSTRSGTCGVLPYCIGTSVWLPPICPLRDVWTSAKSNSPLVSVNQRQFWGRQLQWGSRVGSPAGERLHWSNDRPGAQGPLSKSRTTEQSRE